ncbi:MAG: hypothetical protein WCE27_14445, partial [Pseudolabrys sp.]
TTIVHVDRVSGMVATRADNSISKISHPPRAAEYTDVRPRDPNVRQTQQRKAVAVRTASPVALTF